MIESPWRLPGLGRGKTLRRSSNSAARGSRRRTALLIAVLSGLLVPAWAFAQLAPSVQADLLLVQTEAYLKEKRFEDAREAMGKILKLQEEHGLTRPDEFYFKYAQVAELAGAYEEAIAALHQYLEVAGQQGTYYREALQLLHKAMEGEQRDPDELGTVEPGTVFRDCEPCPEMIVVPAGNYLMGSPASEEGRYAAEGPRHRVTIGESFAVGVYEATFAEWDACVQDGGCNGYRPDDEGWGRGRQPVTNVSWEDAQEYVRWLSRETGAEYRLLSEAEWEYVARAGTTTPFHTGTTISVGQANYDGNYTYGNGRKGEYRRRTVAVGSFAANAFGVHDVHGNVWEWVQDCWNSSYAGAPTDGTAWETGECSRRVLRGGSWDYVPWFLRSAYRYWYDTGYRDYDFGFRVARTLDS